MFEGLRAGNLLYILQKSGEKPELKIGEVTNVTPPQPKLGGAYLGTYPTLPSMTVDAQVKVGEEVMDFKQLPCGSVVANFGQVIVTDNKESMNAEVDAMLRTSKQTLDSIPYHKRVIESCEKMLKELNPQYAKEKAQEEEINGLKNQMEELKQMLAAALKPKTE